MMQHGLIGQNVMVSVSKPDSGRVKILDQFYSIGPRIFDSKPFKLKKKSFNQKNI